MIAWWYIALNARREPTQPATPAPGIVSRWERVRVLRDGVPVTCWGARLPEGISDAELARLRTVPYRIVISEEEFELPTVPSAVDPRTTQDEQTTTIADQLAQIRAIAKSRGWRDEDIDGTGQNGDAGSAGGHNQVSGLSLAELSLTRPPIDWPELAARGRPPWESTDWLPPHRTWVAPGWAPLPPLPDRRDLEPIHAGSPILAPTTVDEVTTEPEPEPELKPDDNPDELGPETQDVLAGLSPELIALARQVITEIGNNPVPHPNKINFYLRKAGFTERLNTAQIAALL